MLGSPLQYQSLMTVLLHTDANTRFRISTHMPSIRNVERRIPLKVNRLMMSKQCTVVNDTSYRLEVVRYHPAGSMYPWPTKVKDGRWTFDFDEFGFQVNVGQNVLLPGDISFQMGDEIEEPNETEEIEMFRKKRLEIHEKAVELLTYLESEPEIVTKYIETLDPDSVYPILNCLHTPLEDLQRFVKREKLELLPFECRRNNVKSPFKYFIELTVTKRSSQHIKRFEYTKKHFEAVKQLHEVFFGGRSEPVLVQLLDLIPYHFTPPNGIYRLPTDCRLHANQVNALDHNLAHASFPLLVGNSESLDTLWVRCISDSGVLRNQMVRSSKKLVIDYLRVIAGMGGLIRDLANREISMVTPRRLSFPMHYAALINAWLRGKRPAGALFWVQVKSDKEAREVLRMVGERHANAERIERCVTIPRDNATKANIYYTPTEGPKLSRYNSVREWTLKVEIVNV